MQSITYDNKKYGIYIDMIKIADVTEIHFDDYDRYNITFCDKYKALQKMFDDSGYNNTGNIFKILNVIKQIINEMITFIINFKPKLDINVIYDLIAGNDYTYDELEEFRGDIGNLCQAIYDD